MSEKFYGPWSLVVVSSVAVNPADYWERFIIAGSDATDGVYPGVPGTALATVGGQAWTVAIESRVPLLPTWYPTTTSRSATYTAQAGLIVYVSAADNNPLTNMFLVCRSLNPAHHPMKPGNPYDFTVSADAMARYLRTKRKSPRDDPRTRPVPR
jgi:hypothetical protein